MAAMASPGRTMTAAEVAGLLRCSTRTVYRLGMDGQLGRVRVGRRLVRFTEASVAALVGSAAGAADAARGSAA